jgi:hypothetical protein
MHFDSRWSDTDRAKPKYSEKMKALPLPLRPPQISHGLAPEIQPRPPRCWDISVAPKVCSADPKKSATSSQGIRGHISVMAALKLLYILKLPYILIERINFTKNNHGTSVISYVFILCDH